MKPEISKDVLKRIEKTSDAIASEAERLVRTKLRPVALKLLNKFQARVKTPVKLVECNGDFWLVDGNHESARYKELCGVMDDVANPTEPGSFDHRAWDYGRRQQELYMRAFPELMELWWIAYECDAMPTRPGLGEMKPTVKPRG